MVWIATTQQDGVSFGNTGKFFAIKPTATPDVGVLDSDIREATLPSGVNAVRYKPAFAVFNGDGESRLYLTGAHTDNLVFTENFALLRQGILPLNNDIVNAAGSGQNIGVQTAAGPGFTANVISYVRWFDRIHNRRSPLSGPSPIVAYANQQAAYSNLPASPDPPDPSVTDIEIWEARDGQSPRLAVRRDVGTTSVTHATPTLSLGEAETEDFRRFPRCRFTVTYHDRQVMAGDDRYPDRVYFSVLSRLEQYAGFFLRTRRGEHVVGLVVVRDLLIVLCARSSYIVQGYTEDDIQMNIFEPHIGAFSHHAVALCHSFAIIPSQIGPYLCTGNSMHFIGDDFQNTWRTAYRNNRDDYEQSWAVNDVERNVYKLFVGGSLVSGQDPPSTDLSGYWVLDYTPLIAEVGGNFAPPNLSYDIRHRQDSSAAMLSLPGGRRAWCFTGSDEGRIRLDNVQNDNDDADIYNKAMTIRTGHYFFDSPGGSETDGNTYATAWNFQVSERRPYKFRMFVGDEFAYQHRTPDFEDDVDAGGVNIVNPDLSQDVLAPKTVHYMNPGVSGRGATVEIFQENARAGDSVWSGFGGTRLPGVNNRQVVAVLPPPEG